MQPRALIEQLGPHAATRLGLDLCEPAGRDTWLLACLLLSARAPEARAQETLETLLQQGLLDPEDMAGRSAELARALASGPWKEPEPLTARLLRVSEALRERGGVDALESASDGLDALGEELVGLAPGLGPATVLRFLRPLRGVWADAADTPSTPAALAAATCLGWASEGAEALALPDAPGRSPADLEAALERLGAAACRSGRSARCPLADQCPKRDV
jgi:hypothetical protein